MRIGVLGLQGGVAEHIYMLRKVFNEANIGGEAILVTKPSGLKDIDGIIIPGGESTTIGKIALKIGLLDELKEYILNGLPSMGVCAGAIMMAKKILDRVLGEVSQPSLNVMDIEVVRNYFGRQRESFEIDLNIPVLGSKPFRGVFIRAPAITGVSNNVEALAYLDKVVVFARQDHMLAVAFHPELTNDVRVHRYFINLIRRLY